MADKTPKERAIDKTKLETSKDINQIIDFVKIVGLVSFLLCSLFAFCPTDKSVQKCSRNGDRNVQRFMLDKLQMLTNTLFKFCSNIPKSNL